MSEQPPGIEKRSLRGTLSRTLSATATKIVFILLAGSLSMFFAEALSGSSVLWFVTPWAWLVTFWLYLAHLLLFINLALIFRRTSLTVLYLWGVLFGLHEAWITKVTWAGYAGQAPGIGKILGFAIPEFPLIVFFWHPVFSFILPVLAFEVLSGKTNMLPGHRRYLSKRPRNWLVALSAVLIGATFLSMNAQGNLVATVVTIVGSVVIIGVLYLLSRGLSKISGMRFSIESLRLGKIGMFVLLVYLALLYVLAFVYILPERTASPLTILLTLGVYTVIVGLLYLKKPDVPPALPQSDAAVRFFGLKELLALLAILTFPAALLCLLIPLGQVLGLLLYFVIFLGSPVLFLMAVINVARDRYPPGISE